MGHPYRKMRARLAEKPVPILELRRSRPVLAMIVGAFLFLTIVFALCLRAFGARFILTVPGIGVLLVSCVLAFFALSLPFRGGLVASGIVLTFLYGSRTVSWESFGRGRRSVLNADLLSGGETALLLITLKVHGSPTRLCFLPLQGWRSVRTDPWSPDGYETAVDRKLRELEGHPPPCPPPVTRRN